MELKSLGLNRSELEVYTNLLKLGVSGVATVSRETKTSRTNCYHLLRKLEQVGLAVRRENGRKRLYEALPPENLLKLAKQQQQLAAAAVETLKNLVRPGSASQNFTIKGETIISKQLKALTRTSFLLVGNFEAVPPYLAEMIGFFEKPANQPLGSLVRPFSFQRPAVLISSVDGCGVILLEPEPEMLTLNQPVFANLIWQFLRECFP